MPNDVTAIATRRQVQQAFIEALERCGSMTVAADQVGVTRQAPYDWLASEGYKATALDGAPEGTFARALLQAKSMAAEHALGRLHTIMDERTDMPAAVAAMFTVKRWYPEYRDQLQVKHSGTVTSVQVDLAAMPPADRAALLEIALQHERQKLDHPVPALQAGDPSD